MICYVCRSDSLQDMQCMLQTQPHLMLMGGHQPLLVELDVETRKEIRQVDGLTALANVIRLFTPFKNILTSATANVSIMLHVKI